MKVPMMWLRSGKVIWIGRDIYVRCSICGEEVLKEEIRRHYIYRHPVVYHDYLVSLRSRFSK